MGVGMAVGDDVENNSENAEKQFAINFGPETTSMTRWRAIRENVELSSLLTPEDIFTLPSLLCVRMHFVCTFSARARSQQRVGLRRHAKSRMHFMHLFWELESFSPFSFKGKCIRCIKAHTTGSWNRP